MKLFLRTMLITWAVMSLIAVIALSWPSVFAPSRERSIPIHELEVCAAQAVAGTRHGAQISPAVRAASCPDGRLVAVADVTNTDLTGRPLSRDEVRMVSRIEHEDGLIVSNNKESTTVALRAEGTSDRSYVYLAVLPATPTVFLSRHLSTVSPIFIAGFLSLFVAAYVVRPLTGLNAVAEQFGTGDLKARIHSPLAARKDELGDLARTFNGMAERIESLVTGYKDFLAHASHELGSPLTRLNIALALAQRKAGSGLEVEHDRIRQEADRLNSLVQEMLLLARLESGNEVNKETSSFDVRSIIEEAYENAKFEAEQLHKSVTLDSVENFVVRGYPILLQRAVDNVIRNALRFAETSVTVHVSHTGTGPVGLGLIAICDDGPGIPVGHEETIFEPFLTLSGTEPAGIGGGSGLGLAIAKQAILANGGGIRAKRSPGFGLIVEIELPVEA